MAYRVRSWYAPLVDAMVEPAVGRGRVEEYRDLWEACKRAAWLALRGYVVEVEGPSAPGLRGVRIALSEGRALARLYRRAADLLEKGGIGEAVAVLEEAVARLVKVIVASSGRARFDPSKEEPLEIMKLAQSYLLRGEAPQGLVEAAMRACLEQAERFAALSKAA